MEFSSQILLSPFELAMMLGLCGYIIWSGRPEWSLGAYMGMTLWTRIVMVGPVAHTWVLLGTTVLALLVYLHRDRKLYFTPAGLRRFGAQLLPAHDRWIVLWMLLWWGWMILVINQYDALPLDKEALFRQLILQVIVPLLTIWAFAVDLQRVRGFAGAYLVVALLGAYYALVKIDVSISYLIQDPGLSGTSIIRLGIRNYHFFSHMLTIGMIFAVSMFMQSRKLYWMLLLLAASAILAHFILLAGARQSMSGGLLVLFIFVFWSLRRSGIIATRALMVTVAALLIGLWLFQAAPHLIIRDDESNVGESFNIFAEDGRFGLWRYGLQIFLTSPVWGTGFENSVYSHNLFIGTLADQGVVGLIFFLGFLAFVARQTRGLWHSGPATELSVWRITFLCVMLFGMIHGQASGNTISTGHLYWSSAVLWALCGQYLQQAAPVEPAAQALAPARQVASLEQAS